jgi:hypothetical protein
MNGNFKQTPEKLKSNLPSAYELYETYIRKIMSAPQEATLQSFGS